MSARVVPAQSPALGLVAPFFVAAPAFLVLAGLLIVAAPQATFAGINIPHTVAITHALLLGWITTTMMGALYQMAPVVLGADVLSVRLARAQFVLHVGGVLLFVHALEQWQTGLMAVAGVAVAGSLAFFAINIGASVVRARVWSAPRVAVLLSLLALACAAALGVTWVLALRGLWFPITLGRLSAHAHVGLLGWFGLTLAGLSYQLVPMFNVVTRTKPRHPRTVLVAMAAGIAALTAGLWFDPPPGIRIALAALVAVPFGLWGTDLFRLLRARSKGNLDVQGRATFCSLGFLALAIILGLAAAGGYGMPNDGSARLPLAYAAAGAGGWVGIALAGNTFRILPFLVWYHRYRPLVGRAPVPVVHDLYAAPAAHALIALLAVAVITAVAGALAGSLPLFRLSGLVFAGSGALHAGAMLHMFLPKRSSRLSQGVRRAVPS